MEREMEEADGEKERQSEGVKEREKVNSQLIGFCQTKRHFESYATKSDTCIIFTREVHQFSFYRSTSYPLGLLLGGRRRCGFQRLPKALDMTGAGNRTPEPSITGPPP